MRRWLLAWLAIALAGSAQAGEPPPFELSAHAAWGGWSRPGRVTEVEVRVAAAAATSARLEVVGGGHAVAAELNVRPGSPWQLHVPVPAAAQIGVRLTGVGGEEARVELAPARSEAPLLAVVLAAPQSTELGGFRSVEVVAADLPHHAAAYAAVDALLVDAATLARIVPAQLDALLAHAAACGRVAVVDASDALREVLGGHTGCGGRTLVIAGTVNEAVRRLAASLEVAPRAPLPAPPAAEIAATGLEVWRRAAVVLGSASAAVLLAAALGAPGAVLLGLPGLVAAVALASMQVSPPRSQLAIWSEADSAAPLAAYQAWQRHTGVGGDSVTVPVPAALGAALRPCPDARALQIDWDAERGIATAARFETRLFGQTTLCFAGAFPHERRPAMAIGADGRRTVRNAGARAWPEGWLLADGAVHALPRLSGGATTSIDPPSDPPRLDPVLRLAVDRAGRDGVAALWPLEREVVADPRVDAAGWLFVSVPR